MLMVMVMMVLMIARCGHCHQGSPHHSIHESIKDCYQLDLYANRLPSLLCVAASILDFPLCVYIQQFILSYILLIIYKLQKLYIFGLDSILSFIRFVVVNLHTQVYIHYTQYRRVPPCISYLFHRIDTLFLVYSIFPYLF